MKQYTLFLISIFVASGVLAAQDGQGHCISESSDRKNWHPCSSDSHNSSSSSSHDAGGSSTSGKRGNSMGEIKPSLSRDNIPDVQYSEAYKWRVLTKNGPEDPLPFGESGKEDAIRAQALIDRVETLRKGVHDAKLLKDWTYHLGKGSIELYWSWENPELMDDAIKELNGRAIALVKENLHAQLSRLEAFEWNDSPQLKQLKLRIAHQREQALDAVKCGPDYSLGCSGLQWLRMAELGTVKQHQAGIDTSTALQELIHASETGAWEKP
ncbi:MAG TPA: hypothetical protein VJW20_08610 [Candidatus Angelobacter sp.]|nr:hypothetical protein [Candidatus Angelobacter sp.]